MTKALTFSALRTLALTSAVFLGCAAPRADVVHQAQMTFTNGSVFNGSLTFKDAYSSLQGVSGNLVGGTNVLGQGYGTVSFDWSWYAAFGDPSADDDARPEPWPAVIQTHPTV